MGERTAPDSLAPVQDLVNTLDVETGQDALGTPDGLYAFTRAHGLTGAGLGADDLPAVRRLREALRAACLAHTGPDLPQERRDDLDTLLSRAPLTLLVDTDGSARLRPAPDLTGVPALTARIAAGIAAAHLAGDWPRLKACEAEDCRWAFYDRSPAGRSRWCSMAVCGSRAKMRAYRAKRRRN